MLKNQIKIALRNLLHQKTFSILNIFGLSIGIATCLVIMLFVYNELSYDRYNEKADRMVRVVFRGMMGGGEMKEANVMPPVAKTLQTDYPEVLEATRIHTSGSSLITYRDKSFKEDALAYVDSNFFQVFTIALLQGDVKTALIEPNTIVISQAVAHKYFGKENPIGKVLNFKSWKTTYKITGVFDKVPVNSHFHFDLFASMASVPDSKTQSWMTSGFYTYLVLPAGYNYKQLEAQLPEVVDKYMGPQVQKAFGMNMAQFREKGNDLGLFLQPLTDIHLRSDLIGDLDPHGDIRYVYIFSAIALFMLLIACINFMNLSTAGASKRAREVGIRKVLGSMKLELIRQFLLESVILTIIALLLSIGFVYMALPFFNQLAGTKLTLDFTANLWLLPGLLLFGLFVCTLAGSYPAFFLSSFNPISVLKGKFTSGKQSIAFRSGLVVFQFFVSIILIISTTVVYKQLSYIQNKKLGYNKDQVLVIPDSWQLGKNQEIFRNKLLQDPRVLSVSTSNFLPAGNTNLNNYSVYPEDQVGQYVKTPKYEVDYNYLQTLGIELVAGRNFSKEFSSDSSGVIINESAAKAFGWGKNALGHTLTGHTNNEGNKINYHIIGVAKDFHFKPLHERISPLIMVLEKSSGTMIVKAKTKDIAGLLTFIKKQWTAEEPFAYSFMDDRFNKTYQSEQRIGVILGIFAGLTIFVACLGLFGLATFTARQRTKEIGVRKVLGASVVSITTLLSKDFIKLVLIAIIIASPLAWYFMNLWLQDFAYRINIQWWMFVVAGALAVFIAILTVSFQAIKAALANPVKSLRTE